MKNKFRQSLKNSRIGAIATMLSGIIFILYMIKVEAEPGALPLFVILVGTVWLIITQLQIKKSTKQ